MSVEHDIELWLNTMIKEGPDTSKGNLQFQMDNLFGGINFKNKRVLDIGGGSGFFSFYAACSGAKEVVCLEPEAEGSSLGVIEKFQTLNRLLKRDEVTLEPVTFQAFKPDGKTFDIILLHNSINHLDETACINLLKDDSSKEIYIEIFSKINSLSSKGAKLIICDCSRYNFFAFFKIPNPFCPTIAWHKHQAPATWANLLGDVGFVNPIIRWSSFAKLRHVGRVLLGNKFMSYFLKSYFCLIMDKP